MSKHHHPHVDTLAPITPAPIVPPIEAKPPYAPSLKMAGETDDQYYRRIEAEKANWKPE